MGVRAKRKARLLKNKKSQTNSAFFNWDRLPVATCTTTLAAATATSSSTLSASAPTTASAMACAPATPAAATFLRPSLIHHQGLPQKIFSVQRFDGFHGFGIICNFGKPEAARLVGEAVAQQRK